MWYFRKYVILYVYFEIIYLKYVLVIWKIINNWEKYGINYLKVFGVINE